MQLLDTEEVITPIDDPCQFVPAWRSIVAGYLFSMEVRTEEDLRSIAKTGSRPVKMTVIVDKDEDNVSAKPKMGRKPKPKVKKFTPKTKTAVRTVYKPVPPFDTHPEYRCLASDKWIIASVISMDDCANGRPSTTVTAPLLLARRWYQEPDNEAAIKKRIEPLLLTGIDMDTITLDLMGVISWRPALEAYERMYFNCRVDNWEINPSMQLIQRFAMPWGPLKTWMREDDVVDVRSGLVIGDGRPLAKASDIWRAIAALLGYEALMFAWQWNNRCHGIKDNSVEHMIDLMWKASAARQLTDLFTGNVRHEDVARLLSAFTSQSKHIIDSRSNGASGEEGTVTKALMAVLYQTSPKMITIDAEEEAARNSEIQSRIQSQLAIAKQSVEDKGAQINQEVMDEQISNAIK